MAKQIRCQCGSNAACKLCNGRGFYIYEPGPRGWMLFTCPTCEGTGTVKEPGQPPFECPTCHRDGYIDPANSPMGVFAKIRKIFLGG